MRGKRLRAGAATLGLKEHPRMLPMYYGRNSASRF
jgi:hypothetical protein